MNNKRVGLSWLINLDIIIAGIALVVLVTLTLFGALSRYFLNNPFTWMEEIQLLLEVWVVFLGAGYAFRAGGHVAVELLVEYLPEKVQKIIEYFIAVIVIGTIGYLLYQSMGYFDLFQSSERTTSILRIPYTLVYGIVPIACVLMLVNYIGVFIVNNRKVDAVKEEKK
ncbi:TRAP transporter small permease [Proteiniclasticum sp. SCR006]|uniref:TRAP transporter small permease n=1 Tax=Proteiniclasticum aestuarii TaxID=2817862 RepID=A0A939HDE5_9CLOT|nr:TRAP transporter small permease [Proteiniclasticum aestuarii]MBO1265238.1 TRAP transporter small permease [Proteiniclasticum aestuarii]